MTFIVLRTMKTMIFRLIIFSNQYLLVYYNSVNSFQNERINVILLVKGKFTQINYLTLSLIILKIINFFSNLLISILTDKFLYYLIVNKIFFYSQSITSNVSSIRYDCTTRTSIYGKEFIINFTFYHY